MAQIPTFTPVNAGTPPAPAAAAAADTAQCGNHTCLLVRNADAAPHDVTIVTPATLATGAAYPDLTVTVPAAAAGIPGEVWIPMLNDYADPSDGMARVNYADTTGMTRIILVV